ncbi:MAG: hypothetical protein K9L85_01330 [Candidatus Peribacteraceae bacterium]|nr:hypothetical protein [Candidatus Peribacteraceae bacterium]
MQKLNLKKHSVSILLALIVVFLSGANVFAETAVDLDPLPTTSTTKSKTTTFEVSLQTPFVAPPTKACEKGVEDKTQTTSADGKTIKWVCRKDSIVWNQVIEGADGNEILTNYAELIYKFLAGIIGAVAVLMVVVGGIEIATAGANQNGLQSGRDRILAALVGLAILFLSSLILYTINPTFFTAGS